MSEEQLLMWTIATGKPSGVCTISISRCTFFNGLSKTFIENSEVPTEMLPVRSLTLLVEIIPVPASPSGGAMTLPDCNLPLGSSNLAPAFVKLPAF